MEPSAFDQLSRVLAATSGRRGAVAVLTGALSAMLSRRTPPVATAQPRTCRPLHHRCFPERGLDCCVGACRHGRCRCSKRQRACRGRCIPKRRCCHPADCPGNQTCRNGRCRCPAGTRRCGKRCRKRCGCAPGLKPCQGGCIARSACCGGCDGDHDCVNGACVPKPCGNGRPCRVFVTSTLYTGDLREGGQGSGIAGADAKCQARAQAGGLSGTYKAWLSGSTLATSPSQRFTNIANTGPYVLVDAAATVVAADWAELTSGTLQNPINVTELGQGQGFFTWTHTLVNGTPGGVEDLHCEEWTSAASVDMGDGGHSNQTDSTWTEWVPVGFFCHGTPSLYCFEQG